MIPSCQSKVNSRVRLLKPTSLYILWLACFTGGALVNSYFVKIGLGIIIVLVMLLGACLVVPEPQGNKPSLISSLEAEYISVYPRGASEIRCVVSNPESDAVHFTWSSTGGTLKGNGATVTWEAPIDYGDYHIMVIAKDGIGASAEATLTISVVPRPYRGCCGR